MRITKRVSLASLIALLLVIAPACTKPVPPTVTRPPIETLNAQPRVYVRATQERERILASLRNARILVAESIDEADYVLTVVLGNRRVKMQCGGMHNIIYTLGGAGSLLLEMKGRGYTGECIPNIFDDMSAKLATYFGS